MSILVDAQYLLVIWILQKSGQYSHVRIALYQPDIAPNAGAIFRLAAVLGVEVDLIEPAGFVMTDRRLKRVGLDYLSKVNITRHVSWQAYSTLRSSGSMQAGRLLLLTTSGGDRYIDFDFCATDTLLLGRETAGVPAEVHSAADARLRIPMNTGQRSLNVAVAVAMVLGEAFRQTNLWPDCQRTCDEPLREEQM
ncbi:MAG: tRNA (cytidine(34)-2'-O)-methyltransferase [Alphaproteobacteria bacterium]